jgi:hypothetical protein
VSVLLVVVGAVLIVGALLDAANTLVSTRLQVGRYWPAEIFTRLIWPIWGSFRRIRDEQRREIVLSAFAPASLIGLLVLWVLAEMFGWSLIWWAMRESFATPLPSFGDALYFSGVAFFTIGFGDIVPSSGALRALTLVEAFGGLGTLALVIGYLPALYGAYSARESQLLMLDDLTGDRIQPISLIEARAPGGDVERLYAFFGEWEHWTAQVLETHTSYPMLALFRSQHLGQSWVTALGVVLDAASMTAASVIGADEREPIFLYRRGNRTLHHFIDRFRIPVEPPADLSRSFFRIAYGRMAARGLPLHDFDDAFERLVQLRRTYSAELEALIDELLAPRGFWSHTITSTHRPRAVGAGAVERTEALLHQADGRAAGDATPRAPTAPTTPNAPAEPSMPDDDDGGPLAP